MARIIGISCFFHDAAVAAVEDDRIHFAIQEERLSRRKHDAALPKRAWARALEHTGWRAEDVDLVVFYEDPQLKLERLEAQVERFWPDSRLLAERGIPAFKRDKLPVAEIIRRELGYSGPVRCGRHHLSHAAAAFYTSPFERAAVLTVDGVGEKESAAIFLGEGNALRRLESTPFPDSLGLFYSVFTAFLGFRVNNGEYKVMGLAPYGEPRLVDQLLGEVIRIEPGGRVALNLDYFDFCHPTRHFRDRLATHLGVAPRQPESPIEAVHQDLAASVQQILELGMLALARRAISLSQTQKLCLAGGVALNCTANARLVRELGVDLHIHPASGDAGAALGAALHAAAEQQSTLYRPEFTPYLGVDYGPAAIDRALAQQGLTAAAEAVSPTAVARRLAAGEVVAVARGREEWGPRALGARSILADPRGAHMREHVNAKIKFRESFRPFAPVVLEQRYGEYFEELGRPRSPHMLFTHRAHRPEDCAATVHVDGTSRVQTVNQADNAWLHAVIRAFEAETGVPIVLNTSFNLRGEPMVSAPEDALRTFFASEIDHLVLGDRMISKAGLRASAA